ncbi:MAG: glutaredoxin family protein [Anaerolineae bacterium]|nr:glutaredoxin family protein [Anaerolineae bacterium]
MAESRGSIPGIHQEHHVKLYALSTCIWCRKTRQFLEDEQVAFEYIYVDLLTDEDRETVKEEVRQWNPRSSFPTIVVDGKECIVGYKTTQIKDVLGL